MFFVRIMYFIQSFSLFALIVAFNYNESFAFRLYVHISFITSVLSELIAATTCEIEYEQIFFYNTGFNYEGEHS